MKKDKTRLEAIKNDAGIESYINNCTNVVKFDDIDDIIETSHQHQDDLQ